MVMVIPFLRVKTKYADKSAVKHYNIHTYMSCMLVTYILYMNMVVNELLLFFVSGQR